MRVVVPHVTGMLHPVAARSLNRHLPGHERVRLRSDEPDAHWRLLTALWATGDGFLVVEQDVGVNATVPAGLECEHPWCVWPYRGPGRVMLTASLGCTRFSAALLAAEPDLLEAVGRIDGDGLPARDWRRLDVRLADTLRARGHAPHQHPPVAHYHRYP